MREKLHEGRELSFPERIEYIREMISLAQSDPVIAEILYASKGVVLNQLGLSWMEPQA